MSNRPAPMPTPGRIVHFVPFIGSFGVSEVRPAMVVHVGYDGLCDLTVFTRGDADEQWMHDYERGTRDAPAIPRKSARLLVHRSSVRFDENGNEGTWRYPARV